MKRIASITDARLGLEAAFTTDLYAKGTGAPKGMRWYGVTFRGYHFGMDKPQTHFYNDPKLALAKWCEILRMYHTDVMNVHRTKARKRQVFTPFKEHEAMITHDGMLMATLSSQGTKAMSKRVWVFSIIMFKFGTSTIEDLSTKFLIPAPAKAPKAEYGEIKIVVPAGQMNTVLRDNWSLVVGMYRQSLECKRCVDRFR